MAPAKGFAQGRTSVWIFWAYGYMVFKAQSVWPHTQQTYHLLHGNSPGVSPTSQENHFALVFLMQTGHYPVLI